MRHQLLTVLERRFNNNDGEQIGWYLARKSNTEPILVMRIEAISNSEFNSLIELINSRVSPIIDISSLKIT